jgi:microcystin-dependent protein
MKHAARVSSLVLFALASASVSAQEAYLGEIRPFANTFCPRGWANTDGQVLSIVQNQALFALLGTTYGGNGQTTFALPDLRARSAVHVGALDGTSSNSVQLGERGGAETTVLTASMLPPHSHTAATAVTVESTLRGTTATANTNVPTAAALAVPPSMQVKKDTVTPQLYAATTPTAEMAPGSVTSTATATTTVNGGGSTTPAPLPTRSPYLAVRYCIALQGIFPVQD